MRLIAQSPYLGYEYLYWRANNLKDNSTNELSKIIDKIFIVKYEGSSRNLLLKIIHDNSTLYYLKQYGSITKKSYIQNEYMILNILIENNYKFIPDIFFYDDDNKILVCKNYKSNSLKKEINKDNLEKATDLLIKLHNLKIKNEKILKPKSNQIFKIDLPSDQITKNLFEDIEYFTNTDIWSSSSLIHFDPRDVNFLVGENNELKLIDWELAIYGDPMWDLAIFLNSICKTLGGDNFFTLDSPSGLSDVTNALSTICSHYEKHNSDLFSKEKLIIYFRLQNYQLYKTNYYVERINKIMAS